MLLNALLALMGAGAAAVAHAATADLAPAKLVSSSEPLGGAVTIFTVWSSRANSTQWTNDGMDAVGAVVHRFKCQLCNQVR